MPALAAALLALAPLFACPEPLAATPTATLPRADAPLAGRILGDSVNVRSGPGSVYDVVAKLEGGARVAILGEAFGWLLVRPESEITVYVSRALIEPKGAGVAIVRRDRVNLRSRAAQEATVVGQASRGDVVRVLEGPQSGATSEFAAIAAPAEVGFYVHHDLVRRLGPAEIAAASALPASLSREGATTAPAPSAAAATPVAAPPAPVAPSAGDKLVRARALYAAEIEKADIGSMDFAPAARLFEEAAREATGEDLRAAALAGLKRARVALRLEEDYRRRAAPLERMASEEREP
jgi:SH3-like domain-containing protein